MEQNRIERAHQAAVLIFWLKVAEFFPEATGNDLTPELSILIEECTRRAVNDWVRINVPGEDLLRPARDSDEEPEHRRMTHQVTPVSETAARVEATGANGEAYVALFSGPEAEARAMEYVAFKNGM